MKKNVFISAFSLLVLFFSISLLKAADLIPGTKSITLYQDELAKLGITINKGNLEYNQSVIDVETHKTEYQKIIVKQRIFDIKSARKPAVDIKVSPVLTVLKHDSNSAALFSKFFYYNRIDASPAEKAQKSAEINNLIAVNYHNPVHNNDIIFWYEPTQEFTDALPDRFKQEIKKDAEINSDTVETYKSYNTTDLISELSIFPNPVAKGRDVSLSFKLSESRNFKIDIYDMGSRLVKNILTGAYNPGGNYTTQFEITDLPSGMYFIVIVTDKGEKAVQRLIVI